MTTTLTLRPNLSLPLSEIELHPIRSQGPGGQHVNKVASAIHLRFDIMASSLPIADKEKLLASPDHRISKEGVIIIKAQSYRSQEKNREEALARLRLIFIQATATQKKRQATRPSKNAKKKRLDRKNKKGRIKALRGKVKDSE